MVTNILDLRLPLILCFTLVLYIFLPITLPERVFFFQYYVTQIGYFTTFNISDDLLLKKAFGFITISGNFHRLLAFLETPILRIRSLHLSCEPYKQKGDFKTLETY